MAGDETVVASLTQPPAGLSCDDAVAQSSVHFQFVKPPFRVKQLNLYLNGRGVPQNDIDKRWPAATRKRGLHPGRNTVDVVATGDAGQTVGVEYKKARRGSTATRPGSACETFT